MEDKCNEKNEEFTKSQKLAYDELFKFIDEKDSSEIIITGSPGYGKSYLIEHFYKDAIQYINSGKSNLKNIIITATTNKAAEVVDGITIHSFLNLKLTKNNKTKETFLDLRKARKIMNTIIIIDECSMINGELYSVINNYTINCKIIYVGDFYQLHPVKSNFSIFSKNIKTIELTEPCRTKNADILSLLEGIKESIRNSKPFKNYKASDNFIFLNDDLKILEKLKTFEPTKDMLVSFTNESVFDYNSYMRDIFGKSKVFEDSDYIVCKSAVRDLTQGIYTKIEAVKKIKKIVRKNPNGTALVEFTDGTRYNLFLDSKNYKKCIDELAITCKAVQNWDAYHDFQEAILDARDIYCGTIHSAQGSTFRNVFINVRDVYKQKNLDELLRLMYVAISRAKEKVYIIDDNNYR